MAFFKRKTAPEWLVVFLGNPGKQYERTRHNAGFLAGDMLAARYGVKINKSEYKGYTARITVGGSPVLLLKPQTYMNLSGQSAGLAGMFYKIPPEKTIMVYDDISLTPGRLRVRPDGSAGGHKGVTSIQQVTNSQNQPRVKIGIGMPPDEDYAVPDWVISKFSDREFKELQPILDDAGRAVEEIIEHGWESAAQKYNR
ncbi:MAG: aminoacyl-tRNA hydrolase [Oscillospiraceae bacterium]|nr:aminoacyl-tRNA hydrolase [Oscillospiraceae bacterium]